MIECNVADKPTVNIITHTPPPPPPTEDLRNWIWETGSGKPKVTQSKSTDQGKGTEETGYGRQD